MRKTKLVIITALVVIAFTMIGATALSVTSTEKPITQTKEVGWKTLIGMEGTQSKVSEPFTTTQPWKIIWHYEPEFKGIDFGFAGFICSHNFFDDLPDREATNNPRDICYKGGYEYARFGLKADNDHTFTSGCENCYLDIQCEKCRFNVLVLEAVLNE